jgi:hypothetical protein
VLAGQHGDLDPQSVQPLDCLPGLVAHHVRDRHEARGLAVHRDEHGSLAFARQLLALRGEAVLGDACLGEEAAAADQDFLALDAGADATSRDGLERVGLGEREAAISTSASHDGLTQGVFAARLGRRHEPQEFLLADPVRDDHVGELGPAPGEGAGLV